jgi:hypothetical protein
MKHFIPLEKAKQMTALYRKEKEHKEKIILPLSETFDAEPFRTILNKPGCVSVRIYYGMDDEKRLHAIIVGVNDKNEDMLTDTQSTKSTLNSTTTTTDNTTVDSSSTTTGDVTDLVEDTIIEEGQSCPPVCPPTSPLNS